MAYEDFTTYTEADPNNHITTITATKVDNVGINQAETCYLSKDKGVDFFGSDFTHLVEIFDEDTDTIYGPCGRYVLTNTVTDMNTMIVNDGEYVALDIEANASKIQQIYLMLGGNGGGYQGDNGSFTWTTLYFVTIDRDYNGGTNNTGRYTAYVRTGSHAGALIDTLVLDARAGAQMDLRYVLTAQSYNGVNAGYISTGYTQNLDLGLDVGVEVTPLDSVWGLLSGLVTVSQLNPLEVTPLDSVWDFVSSLIIATIVYPRLSRKVFSANPACFLCGTKKIAYTLDANTNEG